MSKGSKRRPRAVSREQFDKNWARVFGKGSSSKPGKPDSSKSGTPPRSARSGCVPSMSTKQIS